MLDKNKTECPLTDKIVSYMYRESGATEAVAFETHLADCVACTDEFAAVSNARFSVYEWQKEAFSPLPTPEFSIPYEVRPIMQTGRHGILAGLRELFAFGGWPITAAAAVTLALGLGLLAVNFIDRGGLQVAANTPENGRPLTETLSARADKVKVKADSAEKTLKTDDPELTSAVEKRATRPNRARSTQRVYVETQRAKRVTPKTPVLNPYDDDADTSLRLADLLDGIGS